MAWRLYDTMNSRWYDDELYDTQDACTEAADYHMREAQERGEELDLLAEPIDTSEPIESIVEEQGEQ